MSTLVAEVATGPRIPLVDLKLEYELMRDAGLEQVMLDCLSCARYIEGPAVEQLEADFAAYCGTRDCVAVDSGTAALHLALLASGIAPGDEVIVPANTFIASASAVVMAGARPVFVDSDDLTWQMDVQQAAAAITPRSKAVMPVDLYGQPVDMDGLSAICNQHGLVLIEDACQAHGASYRGIRAGGLGAYGCFSFYPAKNLGAYGDGGAITTNDSAGAQRLRSMRDHGRATKYEHSEVGYNYRMDAVQGAVLSFKLKYLDQWNARRRQLAEGYLERLADLPIRFARPIADTEPVWHLFTIQTPRRDELAAFLRERNIETGVHYPVPLHLQTAFRHLGYEAGEFPVAERIANETLSLPLYPQMTDSQLDRVSDTVRRFFARY